MERVSGEENKEGGYRWVLGREPEIRLGEVGRVCEGEVVGVVAEARKEEDGESKDGG